MSQITPEDIESSFRDVADQIETVAESKKQTAAIGISIAGVIVLVVAFLLGRRSGKKKSSVVEIRRM